MNFQTFIGSFFADNMCRWTQPHRCLIRASYVLTSRSASRSLAHLADAETGHLSTTASLSARWSPGPIWRASVRMSPPPQQLSAVLPRWRAPASRSRSAWKAAFSAIFLPSLTKCPGVKFPSALPASCLCLSCNVTFVYLFILKSWVWTRQGRRNETSEEETTSGTKIIIIVGEIIF